MGWPFPPKCRLCGGRIADGKQDFLPAARRPKGRACQKCATNLAGDLRAAVCRGDIHSVERYLGQGADISARGRGNCSALEYALSTKRDDCVELLLDLGAEKGAKLIWGSKHGWIGMVQDQLAHGVKVDITLRWPQSIGEDPGTTALMASVAGNNHEVAVLLLSKGADPNAGRGTALMSASYACYGGLVQLLLSHGAEVNHTSEDGWTALLKASGFKAQEERVLKSEVFGWPSGPETVQILLAAGANVGARTSEGLTTLAAACMAGDDEVARILLERGADVSAATNDGITPLMRLCSPHYGRRDEPARLQLAKRFLDRGANINAMDERGRTALIWACRDRSSIARLDLAQMLLEKGADPHVKAKDAETALSLADANWYTFGEGFSSDFLRWREMTMLLRKC